MTYNAVATRSIAGQLVGPSALTGGNAGETTTSLACYVEKGSDVTWQWGLNADNSWYKLRGRWITTPFTGLTKFLTSTSEGELTAAANQAIQYYKLSGYTLRGMFAADGAGGYNYPILIGTTELYPKF
ncbi:hypothetical protein [Aquipuribacter sp. MA13-6]|uniref:hypothetical protein n=1 Tax=unclassified Aquipuribacter TaxID=2635084 RepID=UPI003EECA77F